MELNVYTFSTYFRYTPFMIEIVKNAIKVTCY